MLIQRSWILALACMVGTIAAAHAEDSFPSRPIRWVVGAAPGGGTDITVRAVSAHMQKELGQSIIIDNRPGGGTTIAADLVAKSAPDGYTLLAADPGTIIFNTALFKKLLYDPTKDFAPVGLLARIPLLLAVNPSSGFDDVGRLIAAMRADPDKFPVATAGIGSPHHIALEFLKGQAGLKVPHVPYKGAALALQDVLAGQVPVVITDLASGMANIKAGKLKVVATFNAERLASFPDVPSLVQLGLTPRVPPSYLSVVAPAKTPPQILERLSNELRKALSDPSIQKSLKEMGAEPLPTTSAEMKRQWTQDMAVWPALIRDKGVSLD